MYVGFIKDPDDDLDYVFDWSDWLDDGDSIESYVIEADDGITIHDDSLNEDANMVVYWVSGGDVGSEYSVTCQITTKIGRIRSRTVIFRIKQK